MINIGPKIRQERKSLGLSLEKFAKFVGTSLTNLHRIETGAKSPTIDLLYEISLVCRKPIMEFLSNKNDSFYLLPKDKQKRVVGKDYEIRIISPSRLISKNIIVNHYKGHKGAGFDNAGDKGYHLLIVLKGSCLMDHDGIPYNIKKGDVIYYDASKPYSVRITTNFESIRIAIRI